MAQRKRKENYYRVFAPIDHINLRSGNGYEFQILICATFLLGRKLLLKAQMIHSAGIHCPEEYEISNGTSQQEY